MSYFKGIVIFILLVNLISEFIPKDSYKKYLKHISGIILILIIIEPVSEFLDVGNLEDKINRIILEDNILEANEFMRDADNESAKNMIYLYEQEIEDEVKAYLENCNLDIHEVKANIEITDNNELELISLEVDMKFINYDVENEYIKNIIEEKFSISKDRIYIN